MKAFRDQVALGNPGTRNLALNPQNICTIIEVESIEAPVVQW